MKTANINAIEYVDKLEIFEGSNTFSVNEGYGELYVVYSYGHHFPMYIYDRQDKLWIGNKDKYSRTTTKHQSQCEPSKGVERWLHTDQMREYIIDYRKLVLINGIEVEFIHS